MNRERRNTFTLIILLVLLVAASVYWWFHTHEQVEEQYRSSASEEVRENRFLAAERFLEQQGIDNERSDGLNRFQELPSTRHAILGHNLGVRLPEHRITELLDWVAGGGQLITSVQSGWDEEQPGVGDRLVSQLGGIRLCHSDYDDLEIKDRPRFELAAGSESGTTIIVQFPPRLHLHHEIEAPRMNLTGSDGCHLLQMPYGDGYITLVTSLDFISNPNNFGFWQSDEEEASQPFIDARDHAFALWYMVNQYDKLWWVGEIKATPLPELFWQQAPLAVIALLTLIPVWLWWQYNRFGPLRSSVTPERRSILEHLLMSTVYAWRQDRASQLFAATRTEIQLLIRRKHPQLDALPDAERIAKLAEHCQLAETDIQRALHADWRGEREFIELTSLLQQIRKTL